jgi:hypothetical protein
MSGQAYVGTTKRTFAQALRHLLATDYGLIGSRRVLDMLGEDVQALVEQFYPLQARLRPGWMVFTGTKATGKKAYPGQEAGDHQLVTIAWPVILPEDVQALTKQPMSKEKREQLLEERLVRVVRYGWDHPQGPVVLTLADLSVMFGADTVLVSRLLNRARQETGVPLATKGYYIDQGRRPTHKAQIIELYESGVDEAEIALRSQHAPQSVGRYIRDYERVKLLVERGLDPSEMPSLIGLQPSVVQAYLEIIRKHQPELFIVEQRETPAPT